MLEWIKGKFSKKKKKGFTGFKVELYRDGKLLVVQRGSPDQNLIFSTGVGGPAIINGMKIYGYTLKPHIERGDI